LVYWHSDGEQSSLTVSELVLMGSQLLRPLYPGQFHNVKYNMWNVVYIIDLSHSSSLETIGSALNNIIARGFPFRFGIVPSCATEEGTSLVCVRTFSV
jgi:UDP-glucose:glycoprotein glucosyltransferase